jgi:hypothetical protein
MLCFRCHEIYIRTGNVDAHWFLSTDLVQIFQDPLSVRTLKDAKRMYCPLKFKHQATFPRIKKLNKETNILNIRGSKNVPELRYKV